MTIYQSNIYGLRVLFSIRDIVGWVRFFCKAKKRNPTERDNVGLRYFAKRNKGAFHAPPSIEHNFHPVLIAFQQPIKKIYGRNTIYT